MAKNRQKSNQTSMVVQSQRQAGQKSVAPEDIYFTRFLPNWSYPVTAMSAEYWRNAVKVQPLAILARDTLINHAHGWDWKVVPRDSSMLDELKPTIRYYSRLIEKGVDGFDYDKHIDGLLQDVYDLPFGGMTEVGRRDDQPNGRVQWIIAVDGGTLYPTLDNERPVAQYYGGYGPILFPYYSVSRAYLSPRKEIMRAGWGMAPPEKIWLYLDLLVRGDIYYRNLLVDTPPAGILDLGDMEKSSAIEWVNSYKALLAGSPADSLKIPVMYEHNNDIKFLAFGKVPNDLMYDRMMLRYAAIVAAAYGVSLTDIGIPSSGNGGETLAGSIRDERRTRKTGDAVTKKILFNYFNNILPDTLEFAVIDPDEEAMISRGRSMLAYATAASQFVQTKSFTPKEIRRQAIQDGLFTIDLPEEPPADEFPAAPSAKPTGNNIKNPEQLTRPVPVSGGGQGNIRLSSVGFSKPNDSYLKRSVLDIAMAVRPTIEEMYAASNPDDYFVVNRSIIDTVFSGDGLGLTSLAMRSTKLNWIDVSVGREFSTEVENWISDKLSLVAKSDFESGSRGTPELTKDEVRELRDLIKTNSKGITEKLNSAARRLFAQSCIMFISESLSGNESIDFENTEVYDNAIRSSQTRAIEAFDEILDASVSAQIENLVLN